MGVAERRQREKHERRCCILDAAERVFLRQGVAAATMDQVAQEAELSKGTLYLYFKNKDELWLEIANRALEELVGLLDQSLAPGRGLERVQRLMHAYANFVKSHAERFRVAMSWLSDDYAVADDSEAFQRYKQLLAEVFRRAGEAVECGKRDGSIRSQVETSQLVVQLWGGILGVLMIRMSAVEVARRMPHPVDFDHLVPSFIDLLVQALGSEPTPASPGSQA